MAGGEGSKPRDQLQHKRDVRCGPGRRVEGHRRGATPRTVCSSGGIARCPSCPRNARREVRAVRTSKWPGATARLETRAAGIGGVLPMHSGLESLKETTALAFLSALFIPKISGALLLRAGDWRTSRDVNLDELRTSIQMPAAHTGTFKALPRPALTTMSHCELMPRSGCLGVAVCARSRLLSMARMS